MLVRPVYSATVESSQTPCHACGFSAAIRGGFRAWGPELADHNDGFRAEFFSDLSQVESENFWFRVRNALVIWALKKYFPGFHSLLEVGCGSGFVLSGIAKAFPQARLVGSEIFVAGLKVAASRVPRAELAQMDARKFPYANESDVVAAFDVIEHTDKMEPFYKTFSVPSNRVLAALSQCPSRSGCGSRLMKRLATKGVTAPLSFTTKWKQQGSRF